MFALLRSTKIKPNRQNNKHKIMRTSDAVAAVVVSVVGDDGVVEESLEWKTTAAVRFWKEIMQG